MMAYVSNHSHDNETMETAEFIFERYLGYSLVGTEYVDVLKMGRYGFELKHLPLIKLLSVKARTDDWGHHWNAGEIFGTTAWYDIPTEQVTIHTHDQFTLLYVPPTLFGSNYSEIEVTYTAGLVDIPQDVQDAVLKIANLLKNGEIDTWNCQLPVDVLEVIDKYRKEVD